MGEMAGESQMFSLFLSVLVFPYDFSEMSAVLGKESKRVSEPQGQWTGGRVKYPLCYKAPFSILLCNCLAKAQIFH